MIIGLFQHFLYLVNSIIKIYKRMYNAKNILYDKQFGFRKNHNTTDAILLIILNWNTLDLSKAFYTICHKELLVKLENYGIRGNCLNLIKNYLRNRNQITKFDNVNYNSDFILYYSVPQGSVLGPLLFRLYT